MPRLEVPAGFEPTKEEVAASLMRVQALMQAEKDRAGLSERMISELLAPGAHIPDRLAGEAFSAKEEPPEGRIGNPLEEPE